MTFSYEARQRIDKTARRLLPEYAVYYAKGGMDPMGACRHVWELAIQLERCRPPELNDTETPYR
jgi:hypothetical protein